MSVVNERSLFQTPTQTNVPQSTNCERRKQEYFIYLIHFLEVSPYEVLEIHQENENRRLVTQYHLCTATPN